MTTDQFFDALQAAQSVADVEGALSEFESANGARLSWVPVGDKPNNRGIIEVATDPGRSLIERLTNGIDAVLEAEFTRHSGIPECRSPREAAAAWLNVPEGGLSELTREQRRALAQRVTIRILPGDARDQRIAEIRDLGIGLTPEEMPRTILSLNESNKWQKHYLAGTYGQGGSSTLAVSKFTLIASRHNELSTVGFSLVRYRDLPPDLFKTGHYVYLVLDGRILTKEVLPEEFPVGTQIRHFGYDLSSYPSPLGPNSVYGLLNQVLFDPILPVWLDDRIHAYRRVIKGSRNALNGAVDEGDAGDADRRGPSLSHSVRLFFVSLADFGRIGVEYWVLERPDQSNRKPSAAFVNPSKPIVLSLNGQNHAEISNLLVRKHAELPYLIQRLVCHVDCNHLTPSAKRALFVSSREQARNVIVHELIEQELIRIFRSDDELTRLNNEAREHSRRQQDESAIQEMRREVARLLRIHGMNVTESVGSIAAPSGGQGERPSHPRPPRTQPRPIELREPPTYIRIVWEEEGEITFYAEQRRYVRIETDANSGYHNPNNPEASRINIFSANPEVVLGGTTPLQGGRMRAIFRALPSATQGAQGTLRVELSRPGLSVLFDERTFCIVVRPPARPSAQRMSLPPFECRPVTGPEDELWATLNWPENVNIVASSSVSENGVHVIYYSTVYPRYAGPHANYEQRDTSLAESFTKRYEIWLAVHSLLLFQDQQSGSSNEAQRQQQEENAEMDEAREREERCRMATMAAVFASREIEGISAVGESE